MAEKFRIGDIVGLKSGGPKMTVTELLKENVRTAWFAGSKKESGVFPLEAVLIYQEEERKS